MARLSAAFPRAAIFGLSPADVESLHRVVILPVVLAGMIGLLAVASLGHTLVTSTRRRRRDFAILKTLGFRRGQVSAMVAWQATTLVVASLVVGLVVGVAGGRWSWRLVADQLGILSRPVTPAIALLVAVPAAVALANVMAAVPGHLASRVRPATVLRSE